MSKKQNKTSETTRLSHVLVLNKFVLHLLGADSLEDLALNLKEPRLEGYDGENVSYFYHNIASRAAGTTAITDEMLLGYDQNIYRHTTEISEKRIEKIRWKYFQYLALLFTEIYLDRYFRDKNRLLSELNAYLEDKFSEDMNNYAGLPPYTEDDLNKLAFWNATGSGKTLLMHVNIKQFLHYSKGEFHNRIILLTPNEGLSGQHLEEFGLSNINADIFSKNRNIGGLFKGDSVEIIEISKINEKAGDKTVAVDSFEDKNLVLVDEGHRGSSGEVWKVMRNRLCSNGFSFEYSATFGQSISAAGGGKRKELLAEYGKATLFDYSYRYFYKDGYGKDYQILNINDKWAEDKVDMYLTACMLSFYEQIGLFEVSGSSLKPFLIEKPLAIFVGGSVTATTSVKDISDIVSILQFFQKFVGNKNQTVANIHSILCGSDGLVDRNNHSIFGHSLKYLRKTGDSAGTIFDKILRSVFNARLSGAKLHIDNLRGQTGELGLRVGDSEYFGVINVGDDAKLLKQCGEKGIITSDKDLANRSLFATINSKNSPVNILIGSRKFTEGWSSWRVSTMGLMNIGQSEGSQIIQLFGRGVRLRGYNHSLKRSSKAEVDIKTPDYLPLLETLNIFGIRADYMEQFKQYLQDEGLPTNDSSYEEITLPVLPTVDLGTKKLKIIRLADGRDFKKEETVDLAFANNISVGLDYYPKIQILKSRKKSIYEELPGELNRGVFSEKHLAFVNWDEVYFALQQLKNERNWYNLNITKSMIHSVVEAKGWYTLYIPESELQFTHFSKTSVWQEILISLLKLYTQRFYNYQKSHWESRHVVPVELTSDDPNFIKEYELFINRELDHIIDKVKELKLILEAREFSANFRIDRNFEALYFSGSLYQPLLYLNQTAFSNIETGAKVIDLRPVALNIGERDFVEDLKSYYEKHPDFFADKELYLLRNRSRKGIGFFEAKGFYPDFIVWLIVGDIQYVTFVDPKGLRQVAGIDDPKIALHETIRTEIEPQIRSKDDSIRLNSFIISTTPFAREQSWVNGCGFKIKDFNDRNVFFQEDQKNEYIAQILENLIVSD